MERSPSVVAHLLIMVVLAGEYRQSSSLDSSRAAVAVEALVCYPCLTRSRSRDSSPQTPANIHRTQDLSLAMGIFSELSWYHAMV